MRLVIEMSLLQMLRQLPMANAYGGSI
jgi:hypothetical protein